jgi:DNA-binding GntR family transcriptional regulator
MEVARLTPEDVRDIHAMRQLIERAGGEALLTSSARVVVELDLAVQAMSAATARQDRRRVVEADVGFHTAIGTATACGACELPWPGAQRAAPSPLGHRPGLGRSR